MFIREGIFRRATRHNLGPLPVQNADLQKYIIDRQVIFSQNSYFTLWYFKYKKKSYKVKVYKTHRLTALF